MTLGSNAVALDSAALNEYLYDFFCADVGQDLLLSITTGSAQPKFNKTSLRNSEILVPDNPIISRYN